MSKQDSTEESNLQRPITNARGGWRKYWRAQGQEWRTEPEIDDLRQQFLDERRATNHLMPFDGIKLNRADIEWILATHKSWGPVRIPGIDMFEPKRLDLQRANLSKEDLRNLHLEGADLTAAQLEGADLTAAHLEGANLYSAHLEGANLREVFFDSKTKLNGIFVGSKQVSSQ